MREFLAQKSAKIGLAIAALLFVLIFVVPLFSPFAPNEQNVSAKLAAPSATHVLGTDQYGRDVLARVADGGKRSLGAGFAALAVTLFLSLIFGIGIGLIGGIVETFVMRLIDVFLALPSLVLALAIVGVLGIGFENLIVALVLSSLAFYTKLTASYARSAKRRPDVIVARLAGIGWARVVCGHIAPPIFAQMLIVATLDLGGVIIAVAGLSFLGLGAAPPDAEWGAMLNESRLFFTSAPWILLAPATAIFLAVAAANSIGNALRDAND